MAFYLAGIPPIIGGAVLCLIPWVEARRKRREAEEVQRRGEASDKMLDCEKNSLSQGDATQTKALDSESVL